MKRIVYPLRRLYRALRANAEWATMVKNATTDLLDEIRDTKGLTSDYQVAKLLEVRSQTITSYRTGRTQMNDEMALRATRVLGRDPAPVLAQLAAERATHPEVKKVWEEIAVTLASRPLKKKKKSS